MNTENPIVGILRQQWLALVAIVSVGAAFVGQSSTTSDTEKANGKSSQVVSYAERIWDDPFHWINKATKDLNPKSDSMDANKPSENPVTFRSVSDFIIKLVNEQEGHVLVCLNVLDAQEIEGAIESRIRTRHAFEISMSSMKFASVNPDTISYLQATLTSSNPLSLNNAKDNVVLPIKLYQNRDSNKVVLNIWLNQQYLGDDPCGSIAELVEQIPDCLQKISKLAIIGPGDSDKLKAMKPIAGHYTQNEVWGSYWLSSRKKSSPTESNTATEFVNWKEKYWISTSSTVPRDVLWGEITPYSSKAMESGEFKFRSFIDSDKRLISSLAEELRLRIGTYSPSQHDILMFVEQDKEYGRNLGALLTERLENNFNMRIVPYLRGLSSNTETKVSATGINVTDYFERTLARLTDVDNFATSKAFSPAAIGILGGSWEDKIVLIEAVRKRFPQALLFTNDYDERYGSPKNLGITRNLLIVSHGDPVIQSQSNGGELSTMAFRDEYQAAYFKGVTCLLRKALPTINNEAPATSEESPEVVNRKDIAIYEVGNHGILKLTDESDAEEKPLRFLSIIVVLLTILSLVMFPHLLHLLNSDKPTTTESKPEPDKSPLAKADVPLLASKDLSTKHNNSSGDEKLDVIKYHSLVVCVLAAIVCSLPIYICEQEKIWSFGLVSGVSVVPSIVLLILTLPWTWRRTLKGETFVEKPKAKSGEDDKSRLQTSDESAAASASKPLTQAYELSIITDAKFDELTLDRWPILNPLLKKWFGLAVVSLMLLVGLGVFLIADDLWLLQISLLSVVGLLLPISNNLKFAIFVTTSLSVLVQIVRLGAYEYSHVPARDVLLRMLGDASFMVAYWWLLTGLVKMTSYNIAILMHFERDCRDFLKTSVDEMSQPPQIGHSFKDVEKHSENVSRQLFTLTLVGVIVCCARLPLFDAWGMSVGTWFTIIFPMTLPVLISLYLKRAIQRLTARVKEKLETPSLIAAAPQWLKDLTDLIDKRKKGAFAPIAEDPVIASVVAIGLAFFSGPLKDIIPLAKTVFQFWMI